METRSSDLIRRLRGAARVPEIRRPAPAGGGRAGRITPPSDGDGPKPNGAPRLKKLRVSSGDVTAKSEWEKMRQAAAAQTQKTM